MIVAFSSTHHGQTGTTTNALSIAICSALKHNLKILLVSSQFGVFKLTDYLLGKSKQDSLTSATAGDLIRLARSGLLKPSAISNYTIPVLKHSLLDVLAEYQIDFNNQTDINLFANILNMAKRSYDLVILDLPMVLSQLQGHKLLSAIDALVINTNQNLEVLSVLKKLREREENFTDAIICIGNYDKNLKFNQRQIQKYLQCQVLLTIARESQLIDMMNDGCLLDYFGRYFFSKKPPKNNVLINSVLASSDYFLESLDLIKG